MISHLHVGKLKGHMTSHTTTTVNQLDLAHGRSVSLVTTPLKSLDCHKDIQIESEMKIATMKTNSRALKKMMTQNLSLTGLLEHLLIQVL